jgi:hypothetical protein
MQPLPKSVPDCQYIQSTSESDVPVCQMIIILEPWAQALGGDHQTIIIMMTPPARVRPLRPPASPATPPPTPPPAGPAREAPRKHVHSDSSESTATLPVALWHCGSALKLSGPAPGGPHRLTPSHRHS